MTSVYFVLLQVLFRFMSLNGLHGDFTFHVLTHDDSIVPTRRFTLRDVRPVSFRSDFPPFLAKSRAPLEFALDLIGYVSFESPPLFILYEMYIV